MTGEASKLLIQPPPELPRELVLEYLFACRRDLPRLKAALEARQYEYARGFGHQMKGTGKPYGFAFLTEVGRSIESAATQEDLSELAQQVAALESYLGQVEVV